MWEERWTTKTEKKAKREKKSLPNGAYHVKKVEILQNDSSSTEHVCHFTGWRALRIMGVT